jgi:glycosyltransferase involved in cell wall biosynthesis
MLKTRKLKILFIVDTLETGGAEKSLVDIAINSTLFESYFVYLYKGDDLESILNGNGIKVVALDIFCKYGFHKAFKRLIPLIELIQPDVIHSTLYRSDMVARRLKSKFNIPLINSFVNNAYTADKYKKLSFINKLKLYAVQKYDSFTASKVDLFISNSETTKLSKSRCLTIDTNLIKVIYRGRNPEKFNSDNFPNPNVLKAKFNYLNRDIFLNVSRLLESKGQLDLIIAFSEVVRKNNKALLLIAGEGPYRKQLEESIRSLELSEHVILLGNRKDIPELLQLADFFVFPSHNEGLPGAIIEAMFSGKIILCSDIPENRECVDDKSAIFFPKGNSKVLATIILDVLSSNNFYFHLGVEAKKAANEKFELTKVINQYAETYQGVIKKIKE